MLYIGLWTVLLSPQTFVCMFQLQLFSLQLFHRKVQFTACGFFQLDSTLLYAVNNATDVSALPSHCLVR